MPRRCYDYDTFPVDPQVGDVLNLCFAYDEKTGLALFDVNYPEGENVRLECVAVGGGCAKYQWRGDGRLMEIRLGQPIGDAPDNKIRWAQYAELVE